MGAVEMHALNDHYNVNTSKTMHYNKKTPFSIIYHMISTINKAQNNNIHDHIDGIQESDVKENVEQIQNFVNTKMRCN